MVVRLIDALFGCWHSHYSFPITIRQGLRRNPAAMPTGTYVVCLDCGKELPYDWQEMRIVTSTRHLSAPVPSLATKEAA
jgi:hypothetical protein